MPSRQALRVVRFPMVRQEWRMVAFLHWSVPAEELTAVVPGPLVVDTIEGSAWLTLTSFFTTCDVLGALAVPGPRWFPETNLRTYVRAPDGSDGLFFLSLEVTNRSNAALGRVLRLPYHVSDMVIERTSAAPQFRYAGIRRRTGGLAAYDMTIEPLDELDDGRDAVDEFLTGRWSAYFGAGDVLLRSDVEHEPWPLRAAHLVECRQTLTPLTGHARDQRVHYSCGVSAKLSWPVPARLRRSPVATATSERCVRP